MSVIAIENKKFKVYSKGSPEKIKELCIKNSLPEDYDSIFENLSKKGHRILSLAYKEIDSLEITREMAESNLNFAGFLIFENKLKDDTKDVIGRLKEAEIKIKVISGDNVLTTIQSARNAGIIKPFLETILIEIQKDEASQKLSINFMRIIPDEIYLKERKKSEEVLKLEKRFSIIDDIQDKMDNSMNDLLEILNNNDIYEYAITGKSLSNLFEIKKLWKISKIQFQKNKISNIPIEVQIYKKILTEVSVFGRIHPFQKSLIIQELQMFNIPVAMVGDGANDVSALKQADIGVSFSEADASFAAPFISINTSIDCIEKVYTQFYSIYIHLYSFYIHFIFILYSFYIHFIFILYSFYIHFIFILYSFYIHFIFILYSFYIHFIFILYSFYIHFIFILYSFYIHFIFILYSFYIHFIFILYSFYIHFIFILYSFYIHFIFILYSFYINSKFLQ